MSKALLARTSIDHYVRWVITAREAGIPEETINANIEESVREARALLDGKCPKCGAPSARYVDYKLQQGASEVPGIWVMYRCSTAPPPGEFRPYGVCDFMMDLKEGEAAN